MPSVAKLQQFRARAEGQSGFFWKAADLDCGIIAATWDHTVWLASTHLPGAQGHFQRAPG